MNSSNPILCSFQAVWEEIERLRNKYGVSDDSLDEEQNP